MSQLERCGNWLLLRSLGQGGQGEVFFSREVPPDWTERTIKKLKRLTASVVPPQLDSEALLVALVDDLASPRIGALKRLHSRGRQKNPESGFQRFVREVDILKNLSHSALIKVLDSNTTEKQPWLVLEYHAGGSLASRLIDYKGDILRAITDLRPVTEAVALLHKSQVVHRDIKPDNILIAADGRLVLGDLGIAYTAAPDGNERMTDTYENVGTRDWMPPWAHGMRLADVSASFDVFALGKILWAMIAGQKVLRLHYYNDPEFDLTVRFPENSSMQLVNNFLAQCIVERKDAGFKTASEMLVGLDQLKRAVLKTQSGVELIADPHLPSKLFPGTWALEYKGIKFEGSEEVRIDESGVYYANGKPTFLTTAGYELNQRQVVLHKKRLNGEQEFIEHLYQWSADIWAGGDQFGHQLRYERRLDLPTSNTTSSSEATLRPARFLQGSPGNDHGKGLFGR